MYDSFPLLNAVFSNENSLFLPKPTSSKILALNRICYDIKLFKVDGVKSSFLLAVVPLWVNLFFSFCCTLCFIWKLIPSTGFSEFNSAVLFCCCCGCYSFLNKEGEHNKKKIIFSLVSCIQITKEGLNRRSPMLNRLCFIVFNSCVKMNFFTFFVFFTFFIFLFLEIWNQLFVENQAVMFLTFIMIENSWRGCFLIGTR